MLYKFYLSHSPYHHPTILYLAVVKKATNQNNNASKLILLPFWFTLNERAIR